MPILMHDSPAMGDESTNSVVTTAAIGRTVHHSVIPDFDVPSYRTNEAQNRQPSDREGIKSDKMVDGDQVSAITTQDLVFYCVHNVAILPKEI